MAYTDISLKTPEEFTGKFSGGSALIIATGPSTRDVLPYKKRLKEYFDCIIIVNKAFLNFDDVADFHVIAEKTSKGNKINTIRKDLNSGNYRFDLPRILNWKGIDLYNKRFNRYKIQRHHLDHNPNIRSYKSGKYEGLYIGPAGKSGLSLGTSVLPAMHFAGILGVKELYLIGVDLMFKDEFDHYYNDHLYRGGNIREKDMSRNPIIEVELGGKKYQTMDYYYHSAKCIENATKSFFSDLNIFDFSNGLIDIENKLNINEFLK